MPDQFRVVAILVQDQKKDRPADVRTDLLTDDPWSFVDTQMDVVIELIGGTDTAGFLVQHALARGLDVVTANKALVAGTPAYLERAGSLRERLRFSAGVGGAVPVLELISRLAQRLDIEQIDGVLNGTCNYVLDRLAEGCEFSDAVREAQELGFAERDPSLDLSGKDSAFKLAVTAAVAFGEIIDPESIPCEGIEQLSMQDVQRARTSGVTIRLVARITKTTDGWAARVAPIPVPHDDPLAQVRGEENAVVIRTRDGKTEVLHGKGAGRWPTTISVVADLLDLYRRRSGSRVTVGESNVATHPSF
jgi:homoserine dehydrogenase